VKSLPRTAGSAVVKKKFEAQGLLEKWNYSAWAKKREAIEKRRKLNDFERFNVMLAKKVRRDGANRATAKAKKA
jgi:large subunit ribosomal protein L14e